MPASVFVALCCLHVACTTTAPALPASCRFHVFHRNICRARLLHGSFLLLACALPVESVPPACVGRPPAQRRTRSTIPLWPHCVSIVSLRLYVVLFVCMRRDRLDRRVVSSADIARVLSAHGFKRVSLRFPATIPMLVFCHGSHVSGARLVGFLVACCL